MKGNRGERKKTLMSNASISKRMFSFFPSRHLAKEGIFTTLSFLSFFHPGARASARVRVYARVCEGRVKGKKESLPARPAAGGIA